MEILSFIISYFDCNENFLGGTITQKYWFCQGMYFCLELPFVLFVRAITKYPVICISCFRVIIFMCINLHLLR